MGSNYSKFIDDLTVAVSVNLKQSLVKDNTLPRPLTYRSRTNHTLPTHANTMQEELNKISQYVESHQMVINKAKTKVIMFNTRKSLDFEPQLTLESHDTLEVVDEIKLLGLVIRSDLSWSSNTDKMCKKVFSRMWILRRLKGLGADTGALLDTYTQQILSIVEFAAPVWTPGLTQNQSYQIERVQKTAVRVILGDSYISYKQGLSQLKLQPLDQRRKKLCLKFTSKAISHPRFSSWFRSNEPAIKQTRRKPNKFRAVPSRTRRFEMSPIPHMTNIANTLQ